MYQRTDMGMCANGQVWILISFFPPYDAGNSNAGPICSMGKNCHGNMWTTCDVQHGPVGEYFYDRYHDQETLLTANGNYNHIIQSSENDGVITAKVDCEASLEIFDIDAGVVIGTLPSQPANTLFTFDLDGRWGNFAITAYANGTSIGLNGIHVDPPVIEFN